MHYARMGLGLAALLGLVVVLGAEAGGKGAVKAVIYEGSEYVINAAGTTHTYADGDAVGFAILNTTGNDMLQIVVKVQDGPADTTFDVTVVPGMWSAPPLSLTTDKKGKGTLAAQIPIPEAYLDGRETVRVKVILTSTDAADDIYVTDIREGPPFTNPPYPTSTTHEISLK